MKKSEEFKVKIEKGIPLQPLGPGGSVSYWVNEIKKMEVGDSFEIKCQNYSTKDRIMNAFRIKGWRGASRQLTKRDYAANAVWHYRIWRIA